MSGRAACCPGASTRRSGRCARSAAIRSSSPRARRDDHRRRRQRLHRLGVLVGPADPRPRRPGRRRRGDRRRRRTGRRSARPPPARCSSPRRSPARIPSVEMMRMTSSGTEATMSAIRLARAVTGREKVLKFSGRLPRPCRRPARGGRLGPRHAGDPGEPGGSGRRRRRDDRRALERPASGGRGDRAPRARGDPARAGAGEHGRRPAARRGSWRCCAGRPTTPARC